MNKRIRFLLGFGGLAVVLLVVFNMWYPPVSEEATTGAVVAVKKHRQQQIASQDVILGDEAAKKEAQILYADFLTDAAALQNRGADLALALRNRDTQDLGVLRGELEKITSSLEKQTQQVEMRSYVAVKDALGRMSELLAAAPANLENKSELEAQLASLRQDIENRSSQTLAVAEMNAFAEQLGPAIMGLDSALSELASADRTVGRLDALRQDMENKAVDAAALGVIKAELAAMTENLGRSASLQLAAVGRYEAYLASMAREASALGVAREALEVATANLAAKSAFSNADRLALEKAVQELASRGAELENRAVESLESRMELLSLESKAVQDIDGSLGRFSESLDNRSAQQLSAAARQELALGVKAAEQALANRRASFENQSLAAAQIELAALGAHLEQRAKLDNRWAEASAAGNRAAQVENRGAQLENFREYLGRMSSAFANRAAEMENRGQSLDSQRRTELQSRAKELENRAQQLGAASKE